MLPWNVEDLVLDEDRFRGVVRLFPLPGFVLYPHVMQPLHIFEQRYRDLLNDALDGDGLIAVASLTEIESDDDDRPSIHPVACLGKIVAHHRLEDGRYNVMVLGSRRIRIVEELAGGGTYRQAAAEILHDDYPTPGDMARAELQDQLSQEFSKSLPAELLPDDSTCELLSAELPLGVLTDLAAFASPISETLKLQLLRECNVDHRARLLVRALRSNSAADDVIELDASSRPPFPIRFSDN